MSIGLSKMKISSLLRNAGATEEVVDAVAKAIAQNNAAIERDVQRMIDDAVRRLRK